MTGITVLGPVTVGDEGSALPPRDRVVLSVLVAHRGHEVSAETIAEALWGEDLPASWHKVVQGCVARLRRRLGHEAIVTGRDGYRLAVPAEHIDAGRFERLVRRARELLTLDHPDQAAYAADQALGLWRGSALADLEEWEPGRGEAQRLTELRMQAEEIHLDALLASGRHGEALTEATVRVEEQPLREHRWALLARAQYQDGRQADALATLRRARQVLADELGLDPGSELVGLEQAVLQQDPGLAVTAAPKAPRSASPWPGLTAYDVQDADSFFGRDAELGECLARLRGSRLLAVVGPSGSGKSSLVRAGLAARLRDEGRHVRLVAPGPQPVDDLDAALDGLPPGAVLVVDQCEEVFAPTVPGAVREAFLHRLVERTSQGPVVLTLRADRFGELAAHPEVARLVEEGLYLLKGLDATGLREAVERPAQRAGLLLEEGLVDLLLRDVEGAPGSLPLLGYALRETWERRQGSTLTVEGYRASGGIRGAVAQTAERVYEAATPTQREMLRELLLRMVQPGPGGDPVRTSVARHVVMSEHEPSELIEQLVAARLLTTHEDRVEIAHEALVRAWPRLQSWLADDVQGERIRHHLAAAADAWEAMGRPGSELYRGARLAAAREWRDTGSHRLSRTETEFLEASEAAHQSRLARAEQEARRQRGVNRRLRVLVVGVTVLALVAAVFGVLASRQNDRARSQRLSAAALAVLDQDPALAKALAVLGAEAAPPSQQTTGALHRTFADDRVIARLSMHRDTERLWAVLSPDGTEVAMTAEHVYQPALAFEVHDAATGGLVWEWLPPEQPEYAAVVVAGAQYSPDGSVLVGGVLWDPASTLRRGSSAGEATRPPDGELGVHVWDADSHEEIEVVDVGPCGGWPVAVGGDRMLVRTLVAPPSAGLTAAEEESLLQECRWLDGAMGTVLVDRRTGESHLVSVTEALNLHLTIGHALTDDGAYAAVPDFSDWSVVLLDGATGEEVGRFPDAVAHDFDPAGERLLTVDVKGPGTDLWTVLTVPELEEVTTYTGRSSWSFYGRFASDGRSVFTTGVENTLVQWDATTGRHLRALPATGGGVPTGHGDVVLVPRPETAGAVLVDTSPPGELWSVPSCGGAAGKGRLHVTQSLVVVGRDCGAGPEGRLETFTREGTPVASWPGVSWEVMVASPDGRQVVARAGAGTDEDGLPRVGPLTVLELGTGRPVVELDGFCEHTLADFLTGLDLDTDTAARCADFPETPFSYGTWSLDWSPDGRWIAAIGAGVAVWDARTGELVAALPDALRGGPERFLPYDARFSPDSAHLLVTTQTRDVVALDTDTWATVVEETIELQSAYSAGVAGFAADGSVVVVTPLYQVAASTAVLVLDPDRLTVRQVWTSVADGAVQAADVSPDGRRVALATSEGLVTIWDIRTRSLVDQADPRLGALDGVRWLDDTSLVLLSAQGHLTTVTTDPARLLQLNRESLTRGLAPTECATYGLDPCPGLGALTESAPVVPAELQGAYTLTWGAAELHAALVERVERSFGAVDGPAELRLGEQAALLAGSYRLEIGRGDYTISKGDTGEIWCTGSVTGRGDRLLLGAFGGSRCSDFHYAEIGWRLHGEELTLPREEFRGRDVDTVLWTTKALQKVD